MSTTEHESREQICAEMAGALRWTAVAVADSIARHGLDAEEHGGAEKLGTLLGAAADLIERLSPSYVFECIYCKSECGTEAGAREHALVCERHPLRAEIARLERERDALIAAAVSEWSEDCWCWSIGGRVGGGLASRAEAVADMCRTLGLEVPTP